MDRIRPYLFWIVLGVVLVGLAVIRFGPIQAMYAEAERGGSGLRKVEQELDRLLKQGDDLPRPALIAEVEKLAKHYERVLASEEFRSLAMDYKSEFWPPMDQDLFIDFANPPEDENDLNIRLINLHTAQMEQARQVRESFFYNNADPAQGKHFIIPPPGFGITERRIREASEVPRGKTGLRQVLATQRRLWLMKGLFRVLTDPKVGITAVNRIAAGLANPEDVGFPGEPRSEPYVLLNWDIQVELPLEKIPALLNRLAVSERHLRVDDVAILAQPEAVLDYRGGSPTWHRAESPGVGAGLEAGTIEVRRGVERRRRSAAERPEARVDEEALRRELSVILRRQGRLVIVVLKGVSFDFLQLPQGYKGWPT